MSAPPISIDPQAKDDAHYRYKMPAVIIKPEGNGNGVKTVFPNLQEICARLGRPPETLNKFFGAELGSQATYIKSDDKYLVMGNHSRERIQDKVYEFVKRFVLCRHCRNPETVISLEKKDDLIMSCGACGKPSRLDKGERVYKLFVLHAQQAKASAKASANAGGNKADGSDAAAAKAAPAVQKGSVAAAQGADGGNDANADADIADKMRVVPKKIEATDADLKKENPIITVNELIKKGTPAKTLVRAVINLKTELNLKDRLITRLVFRATVEGVDKSKLIGALQAQLPLFTHFVAGVDKADLKAEQEEMCVKELLIACHQRGCVEKFPMGLKMFWEEGIVTDATIFKFLSTTHEAKALDKMPQENILAAKKKCEPLVDWLKDDAA